MCERGAMSEATGGATEEVRLENPKHKRLPWWQRKGPSGLVFVFVVVALLFATASAFSDVADVLPDVGKDQQGDDPWTDQLGVEKVGIFQIAHIPDCAAAPLKGIELWDEDSNAYWKVRAPKGPGTPMATFAVGATPEGWEVVEPYEEPPADAILRLIVVRSVKGVAGVRYQKADLRSGYAVLGVPASRFEVADFASGEFCDDGTGEDGSTTTTEPGA
jgi:hypothetical protein